MKNVFYGVDLAIRFLKYKGRYARKVRELGKNLRLKAARASLDMTQGELAERVGVTRQTICAIEKGDYNPTIRLCVGICRALGKTLNDLFWDEA